MRAVSKVAKQGAFAAFRKIIVRARQPVIEPKHRACAHAARDLGGPGAQARTILRNIAVVPWASGGRELPADLRHRGARVPRRPAQTALLLHDTQFLDAGAGPAKSAHR